MLVPYPANPCPAEQSERDVGRRILWSPHWPVWPAHDFVAEDIDVGVDGACRKCFLLMKLVDGVPVPVAGYDDDPEEHRCLDDDGAWLDEL